MRFAALIVCAALLASPAWAQQDLPDPIRTPGATNPDVTQDNIKSTICVPGFAKSIRPESLSRLKKKQIREYGYSDRSMKSYEEDHLISLELGGNPTDPKNLWPEHRAEPLGAKTKDRLENFLHAEVCAGRMPLERAQKEIATDWIAAYKKYLGQP